MDMPVDEPIEADGESAYFSTLPIWKIVEAIQKKGILAGVSNTAGTYVCNHVMYVSLYQASIHYPNMKAGFIVYTEFGAKASKYKNPVNDVGVTKVYGVDDIEGLICDLRICLKGEHSFTPEKLVNELPGLDKKFFKLMFTGRIYRKIYRLYELEM